MSETDIIDQMGGIRSEVSGLRKEFAAHIRENVEAHGQIREVVGEQALAMRELSAEMIRHGKAEDRVLGVVFGNGGVGIDEKVRALQQFQRDFRADLRRAFWVLTPPVILGAGALVWSVVVRYLQETQP